MHIFSCSFPQQLFSSVVINHLHCCVNFQLKSGDCKKEGSKWKIKCIIYMPVGIWTLDLLKEESYTPRGECSDLTIATQPFSVLFLNKNILLIYLYLYSWIIDIMVLVVSHCLTAKEETCSWVMRELLRAHHVCQVNCMVSMGDNNM